MTTQSTSTIHKDRVMRGILFGCAAMFMFAVMQAFAKTLSTTHNVIEIAFYRNLIALLPLIIWVMVRKKYHLLKTDKPVALLFRALIGSVGLIITFWAVQHLPLADATVIFLTSALMIPAFSFFFLKEYIGIHRWSAIIIGLLGVIVMVGPSGHVPAIGIAIAFAAAITHAAAQIFLRHLRTESTFTVTFYFIVSGVIVAGIFMPFVAKMPQVSELFLFLCVGITGGVGQYCLASALKLAPASVIAPINYTGLLWATLLDIIFWSYLPGWPVFMGGAIIIAAQAYIMHRERLSLRRSQ